MADRQLPQWTSLAQLHTDLASIGTSRAQPLYQVGSEGDDSSIIGHWYHDGTRSRPAGPVDFTAAAWGHAVIASGSGTSYVVDASPTLGTSGTLRPWDVSAAAPATGGDVTYTRVGTAVTLGASRTLAADDVLYEVVGGRTGALDIAIAGEIQPQANSRVLPLATGLYVENDPCLIQLLSATTASGYPTMHAHCTITQPSPSAGDIWALGLYESASDHLGGGERYTGAVFDCVPTFGSVSSPSRGAKLVNKTGAVAAVSVTLDRRGATQKEANATIEAATADARGYDIDTDATYPTTYLGVCVSIVAVSAQVGVLVQRVGFCLG